MKFIVIPILFILAIILTECSEGFLEIIPGNELNEYTLANKEGIEKILIGAYSMLDGVAGQYYGLEGMTSNWLFGSVRGMDANKGSDAGESGDRNMIMTFSETSLNSTLNAKWQYIYESIASCNSVITVTRIALEKGTITNEDAALFINQARGLRGFFHFEAWRMWKMIPYIDETSDTSSYTNKTDISAKILDDLEAASKLPENMGAVGKFNGTVCKIFYAKALMQIRHDYENALTLLEQAKTGKKPDGSPIGLSQKYGDIFDIENRNGIEAIYTVQYSVNDGSGGYNGGYGELLNFPYKPGGSPGGCCGFFQPTQEFVNSFRTEGGLPLLDNSYNTAANQILRDQGIPGGGIWEQTKNYMKHVMYYYGTPQACTVYDQSSPFTDLAFVSVADNNIGNNPLISPDAWKLVWTEDNSMPVDPRLDWTVGRRGIPYWDWGVHTGSDWIRSQEYAGPYSPKKQVYKKSQEGKYTENGAWTTGFTANGYRMIRYADLLLLLAECRIETGDLEGARVNINLVRARAANREGFVKESDGVTDAARYEIKEYPSGYPFDSKENARLALMMERKLELGMEGHRWFDLNRWGIANRRNQPYTCIRKVYAMGQGFVWQFYNDFR